MSAATVRLPAWSLLASGVLHGLVLTGTPGWKPGEKKQPAPLAVRLAPPPKAQPPQPPRRKAPNARRGRPMTRPATPERPPTHVLQELPDTSEDLSHDQRISDLHYKRFYDENPRHPMRCMVGHVAQSSGDHQAAIYIYQDCAKRGDSFSLVPLAIYYELGTGGLARDPAKAAGLFKRAAEGSSGYAPNGMFYYGVALYYGLGVSEDRPAARDWLNRAAAGGSTDAEDFLKREAEGKPPPVGEYFKM